MKKVNNDMAFLQISENREFEQEAMLCFNFQAENNAVYREYLDLLGVVPQKVDSIKKIPFLPIEFFKSHRVFSGRDKEELKFYSSGTTGTSPGIHYVARKDYYEKSFIEGFKYFYGKPENFCFLALLPSYLERKNSSLVYMMDKLIKMSKFPESGFYLDDLESLSKTLADLEGRGIDTILLGVSYALLDLAGQFPMELRNTIIIETGGMKGSREELPKRELHRYLCESFRLENIHSEYGMAELLSQAYSKKNGLFETPPWMRVLIRDPYDPFSCLEQGRSGGINIIDLANRYSCSFLETQDLGRLHSGNSFEILGRFDNSDIRGCNLLVQ